MLKDQDEITFGQHKGKTLEEVPAQWLMWFHNEIITKKNNNVILTLRDQKLFAYIEDNLDALKLEIKNTRK